MITVLTPSYAPDIEQCAELAESVQKYLPAGTRHLLVVPNGQLGDFAGLGTEVLPEEMFLPRSFKRLSPKYSLNLRRPLIPVRGWVRQQLLKLSVSAELEAEPVVLADSDIRFFRRVSSVDFVEQDVVKLFVRRGAIVNSDLALRRHLIWHRRARYILGLPQSPAPFDNYVSSLNCWNPLYVRLLREHLAMRWGRGWLHILGSELHFSEWTLYGLFVDHLLGGSAKSQPTNENGVLSYWGTSPIQEPQVKDFLAHRKESDFASMISARSGTNLTVRSLIQERNEEWHRI